MTMRWRGALACGALGLLALACGTSGGAGPEPVEVLQNGTFDAGTAGWTVWSRGEPPLAGSVVDGALQLEPSGEVPSPEDQGVGQAGLRLEHGAWYELSFRATGDGVTELTSVVRSTADPRKAYAPPQAHELWPPITTQAMPPDTARHARRFLMAWPTDAAAELQLLVGARGSGTLRLDDLSLRRVTPGVPDAPEVEYPPVTPEVDRGNLVVYEVNPFSYDGGVWGGGRALRGIIDRLDRIQALGVNCIWLTPVFDGSGMGYWTRDYYRVNPELGTLDDLKRLVNEAHRRNLLVILDLVVNHTWTEHPFFQDVVRHQAGSPYADYYLWSGAPGASDFAYYYDWVTLPNVNLGDDRVREYMLQVAEHWMRKLDLDGWRVDCAWALEDRRPGFSAELRRRVAAVKPGAFLLGEGDANEARFFEDGYDAAYDWTLRGFGPSSALPDAMARAIPPEQLHEALARALPGLPLRFAENHDHPRAATLWGVRGSTLAHTILLTSRGIPGVFGGGEVGFAPPVGRQNDPVTWSFSSPIYAQVKKLLAIRRRYLAADLTQRWIPNGTTSVYSSLSVSGGHRVLTVANFSGASATATLDLSDPAVGTIGGVTDLLRDVPVAWAGGTTLRLTLPGQGTAVLLLE